MTTNPLARLKLVEVEVHSYCNRKCWFCPNSFICRDGPAVLLPEPAYLRLLADLADAGWHETLSLGRYNEPFGNPVFYRRVRQARKAIPGVQIHTNTNGDFLTPRALALAAKAGLSSLRVMLYTTAKPWTPRAVADELTRLQERLPGVPWTLGRVRKTSMEYTAKFGGLDLTARGKNFAAEGTNRCGLAVTKPYERTAPCLVPSEGAYIDYTGAVMPCCNLRSDFPPHKPYILGVLTAKAGSLAGILASPKAVAWREAGKTGPPPGEVCKACRFGVAK